MTSYLSFHQIITYVPMDLALVRSCPKFVFQSWPIPMQNCSQIGLGKDWIQTALGLHLTWVLGFLGTSAGGHFDRLEIERKRFYLLHK